MQENKTISPSILQILLDNSLYEMAFRDIEAIRNKKIASMSCFILLSCFIDYMAGYYCGVNITNRQHFLSFCEKYLPMYDSNTLYQDIRCKLVHQYTEPGNLVFTDNTDKKDDRTKDTKRIILNLDNFIENVRNAWLEFRKDLKNDKTVYEKALKRYESAGTLTKIIVS